MNHSCIFRVSFNNRLSSYIPFQIQQLLFVSLMENNRVSPSSPKRRNNDPPFSLIKGTNEGIDCPLFEKRLIPQSNEDPWTAGMDRSKAFPDRSAHAPFGMRIDNHLNFPPLK